MLVVYTTQDLRGQGVLVQENAQPVGWFDDEIVACFSQRVSMTQKVRDVVARFGDDSGQGTLNHFVPHSRIMGQLITILRTMGPKGKGMTRRQSVYYLQWVLGELGTVSFEPDGDWLGDIEFVMPNGATAPKFDPGENRLAYDRWVSWAVDIICDWPNNLFKGPSTGDGQGQRLDFPLIKSSTLELRWRLFDASVRLKAAIPGLKVASTMAEPETGWAMRLDWMWASGPPIKSRATLMSDGLTHNLPYFTKRDTPGENPKAPAAPDALFQDLGSGQAQQVLNLFAAVIDEDRVNKKWAIRNPE